MACFPVRYQIAVMLFWHCFLVYMLRVNLSVNILAMRNNTISKNATHVNVTSDVDEDLAKPEVPRKYYTHYKMSPHDESTLLGAYFYGYVATSLFGGVVCEMYSPKYVVGYCSIVGCILTFLTPISIGVSYWLMFIVRFVTGMLAGIAFPANQVLIAKWAPPAEKGRFVATIIGSSVGTVVTWMMSGELSEKVGWDWSFYASGIICVLVIFFWFVLVTDTPATHPYISDGERDYIEESMKGLIARAKVWPPFKDVATSVPFYAVIILHYGHMWGLYFQLTAAPRYMRQVLKFKLSRAGYLAGIPYLARTLTVFAFAAVADTIRWNDIFPVTFTRKFFCVFSHIIPGLMFLLLAVFNDSAKACVAILCVCLAFNAAAVVTNLINVQDLAPNFAGTLYGVMNFFANTAGFLAPIIVAEMTKDKNTIEEWKKIFVIDAFIYIVPACIFIIFGTAELQPWNSPKAAEERVIL